MTLGQARGKLDEESGAAPTSLVTMKVKVSAMGAIEEVTDVLERRSGDVDSLQVKRMGMTGVMEITAAASWFKVEGSPAT